MTIVSDNRQLLRELSDKLKQEDIIVKPIKVTASKDDKLTLQEIAQFVIENPELSKDIIEMVIEEFRKLHNQEHIYVLKKNGEKITYEEYKEMSLAERSEHIF